MIAYREPLSFFLVLALSASSIVFANSENADGELSLLESVSWTEAIEDPSSTGAMISYYSKHPTSVPFFFPRLISIFEFMDIGDPKFCTLKQLSKNPQLSPRKQTQPFKETKFFQKKITESPKEILSLENRIRELEQKLLDVESRPIYQPNDDELRAFINRGHNVLSLEQRLDYLTKIISKENGFNMNLQLVRFESLWKTKIWQEVTFLANLKLIWFLSHYLRQWKNSNPQEVFHQM